MIDLRKCRLYKYDRGYKIGIKIVDEFMRDSNQQPCTKLKELAQKFCTVGLFLMQVGVPKFLNLNDCKCEEYKEQNLGCSFQMRVIGNPLLNYVEVPKQLKDLNLQYQSIIKGVIRGAFEILQLKAIVSIIF